MDELRVATSRARRKAAISYAIAMAAAIFSVLELHGWHIYVGLALTAVAAIYGLTHWKRKYPLP
ncbi:MAG TPA: hypothetical protein VIH97_10550 [Candidatus Acidoferrales bacterium]